MSFPDNFSWEAFDRAHGVLDGEDPMPPARVPPTHAELMELHGAFVDFVDRNGIRGYDDLSRDDVLYAAASMIETACELVGFSPAACE